MSLGAEAGASIVSDNLHNQGFGARAVEWVERALTTVVSLNLYTSPSARLPTGTQPNPRVYTLRTPYETR